jgi:cytochrome c oxidase subunit 3
VSGRVPATGIADGALPALPPLRLLVWLLLATLTLVFGLLVSAYLVRMGMPDWQSLALPSALWWSTAALFGASIALEVAARAANRDDAALAKGSFVVGAALVAAFVIAQATGWRALISDGIVLSSHVSAGFFYLITGLHGAHVLGGLAALGVIGARAPRRGWGRASALGMDVTATYMHFLLVVWIGLFVLISLT